MRRGQIAPTVEVSLLLPPPRGIEERVDTMGGPGVGPFVVLSRSRADEPRPLLVQSVDGGAVTPQRTRVVRRGQRTAVRPLRTASGCRHASRKRAEETAEEALRRIGCDG